MNYVSWKALHADIDALASRYEGKIVGVVGVPRSGALVANLLALRLNIPCTDLFTFKHGVGGSHWWQSGPRMLAGYRDGQVLLLDDSLLSGKAMRGAVGYLTGSEQIAPFTFRRWQVQPAVLYVHGNAKLPHVRQVPGPRVFAWNWTHHNLVTHAMFDMDGVLCHDPKVPEDNEAGYLAAIEQLRPLYIPSRRIKYICTHRLEGRRDVTKHWLERHGVQWNQLIMYPAKTCHERRAAGQQDGTWKGRQYKDATDASWFVESDPRQAERIAAVSGKSVFCPKLDRMFGAA